MERKHTKTFKKFLYIFIILFIASATTASIYAYSQLNKIKNVRISKTDEDLGIRTEPSPSQDDFQFTPSSLETIPSPKTEAEQLPLPENRSDIINIALYGTDVGRAKYDAPHSDSIIIVTLDFKNNKIKLSSVMRDTYVKIYGHGRGKIGDAYAYGGPQLAIRTLNENFNLNIRDYAAVDFFNLEKVIDVLGGVAVEVKDYEVKELNYRIKEAADLQNKRPHLVKEAGIQNLKGIQAVAYCRIRSVGHGDFERTSRQRIVLNELFKKIQSTGLLKYTSLASEIFPMIETSLTKSEIIKLGSSVLTQNLRAVEQERFPLDGYCKGEVIRGIWYLTLKPDNRTTVNQINNFIYRNIKPEAKAPLF
ncbi:LCP family protein [Clostridium sp. YIM B02515]|uniref:LCP family protein n=1 Tax=Clostridium rhizosphaerae TaxID=2803861 RepID=A0ABS1TCL6_9CLOT|nr:LCP family protein [Clostridium rhizosphaerae]MBL4937096.1 LCP family protein [Clostridium rhizosphaerae]